MKITLLFAIISGFLLSCGEKTQEMKDEKKPISDDELSLDELAKRKIESQLSIPGTENYILKVHQAELDGDGIEDAVILVNREQYAHQLAMKEASPGQEQMGFTGNYNFLFYYNGATKKVSRPINVGSSAFAPLKISFENIQSEGYKDFTLDYRILGNCYRNFYTVVRGVPKLVFQWTIFDLEDKTNPEFKFIEFAKGTYSSAKDILIFKGKLESELPENIEEDFNHTISKNGEMDYLFFYNPNEGKYFTKKK
jgi:hypothetical protein